VSGGTYYVTAVDYGRLPDRNQALSAIFHFIESSEKGEPVIGERQ